MLKSILYNSYTGQIKDDLRNYGIVEYSGVCPTIVDEVANASDNVNVLKNLKMAAYQEGLMNELIEDIKEAFKKSSAKIRRVQ